jgi:hypothetical protein
MSQSNRLNGFSCDDKPMKWLEDFIPSLPTRLKPGEMRKKDIAGF